MKRAALNAEIDRLVSIEAETVSRFGERSKENLSRIERLKALRIERMRRDTNFRKRKRAA